MAYFRNNTERRKEFEDHVLEHINSMYNLAWRLTGNKEDAGDLVQEASLRGYRFFHKFEPGTNFRAWILTIERNLFINRYRKKKKEPAKVNFDDFENFIGTPPVTGAGEEVFGESVQQSIDRLPETLKTPILLFYVEGMSYKEIAGIMDCPIGTVMSRLHMARQVLKKQLSDVMRREELR